MIDVLSTSDVFVLLPYVTADGDRDGIPTVLVEAMACRLPVVTTDVAGIADLVTHELNGFLLAPRDIDGAVTAMARLAEQPDLGVRLGVAGRRTVETSFDGDRSAERLIELFNMSRSVRYEGSARS